MSDRSVHENERRFKCELCDFTSFAKSAMKRHISAIHEKFKPFSCESCDFRTSYKESLDLHLVTELAVLERFSNLLLYFTAALDGNFLRSLPFLIIAPGPVHFPVPLVLISPGPVHFPVLLAKFGNKRRMFGNLINSMHHN